MSYCIAAQNHSTMLSPKMPFKVNTAIWTECNPLLFQQAALSRPTGNQAALGVDHAVAGECCVRRYFRQDTADQSGVLRMADQHSDHTVGGDTSPGNIPNNAVNRFIKFLPFFLIVHRSPVPSPRRNSPEYGSRCIPQSVLPQRKYQLLFPCGRHCCG